MSASNRGAFRRRISLLAGSSLVAATIAVGVGGVALTPSIALAANECVPVGTAPTANGAAADSYDCPNTTSYSGTGITYNSAGPLTVSSSLGAINVGTIGINLVGNGSDSITLNTTAGTVTGTGGPVIDASSVSGPIDVTVAAITGTSAAVTYGIFAQSTGGGGITILNTTGNVNINSTSGIAAINAIATGGNGAVSITTNGTVTGRQSAIRAQTSGTGALTVTVNGAANINSGVGQATIDATTGTGLLTVNIAEVGSAIINGQNAAAIRTNAGGDAVINIGNQRSLSATAASTGVLNLTAAGTTTVNNVGSVSATSSGIAVTAAGGSLVFNNDGFVTGRLELGSVTGAATFNNTNTWTVQGVSTFGAGETTFDNAGLIVLNENATATINGLDTFVHSGGIQFGDGTGDFIGGTSVMSMPGVDFQGTGAGVLLMEATLGAGGQADCSAVTLADCLDLSGGSTSGVTSISVRALNAPENVLNTTGIVLVDVGGGESHAGDFVLNIGSTNFASDSVYGGIITTPGMLAYALQYDEATQTHRLVTVVPGNRLEYAAAVQEVLSAWHTTAGVVADRQSDLRGGAAEGFWARGAIEHTARDVAMPLPLIAGDLTYEDSFVQDTATALVGYDLLAGSGGSGDFVLGVHGGYVRSELEREFSPAVDTLDGAAVGLYGGFWAEGLSIDAALNGNLMKLTQDRPGGEVSDTNVIAIGARVEGGWRLGSEAGYVQPLFTAAYVRASVKEVVQKTFEASYDDVQSMRLALGLRAGGRAGAVGYWALGRFWNEFVDDAGVMVSTEAESVRFVDDLSGNFQELAAGVTVGNAADNLEGFASAGAKFHDAIDENYSVSLGFRMRW